MKEVHLEDYYKSKGVWCFLVSIVAVLFLMVLSYAVYAAEYRIVSASKGNQKVYRIEELKGNGKWEQKFVNTHNNIRSARKEKKLFEENDKESEIVNNADKKNLWRVVK